MLMASTKLGELFNILLVQVDRAIKRLIKKGVYKTTPVEGYADRIGWTREVYNMEVIIPLAYELDNSVIRFSWRLLIKRVTS